MIEAASKPRYVQIADELRERIRTGELKVGDRLPSYAEMYREHGATTATMQRVCDLLEQDQLIERRHASGVYVAAPQRRMTKNIGFIGSAGHRSRNIPFTADLMDGIQDALSRHQQHLLHLGTPESWEEGGLEKVDGVVICNAGNLPSITDKMPASLPRVSLLTLAEGVACIGIDDFLAGQKAVRHLVSKGHRRISCLMERKYYEPRRRYAGYVDALLEAGIEPDPKWVRLVDSVLPAASMPTVELYREWAQVNMGAWLKEGWAELGCTAIVVQNEVAGITLIQLLQQAGFRVPQDVSVIGFDGTDLSLLFSPRLTCVALPIFEMGAAAVDILNQQISGEKVVAENFLLPTSLLAGESVAVAADR